MKQTWIVGTLVLASIAIGCSTESERMSRLAEFGCAFHLAWALLSESALDTGLSPAEVRRQIECGLNHRGARP